MEIDRICAYKFVSIFYRNPKIFKSDLLKREIETIRRKTAKFYFWGIFADRLEPVPAQSGP